MNICGSLFFRAFCDAPFEGVAKGPITALTVILTQASGHFSPHIPDVNLFLFRFFFLLFSLFFLSFFLLVDLLHI